MGQSTDAILFYGYVWAEEVDEEDLVPYPVEDGLQDAIVERAAKAAGASSPWETPEGRRFTMTWWEAGFASYDAHQDAYAAWETENKAALDAWHKARSAAEKALGAKLGRHCSGECPMPYIAIPESETTASRGTPEAIDVGELPSHLDNLIEWNEVLEAFAAEHEIDLSEAEGPGWFLVSYWG